MHIILIGIGTFAGRSSRTAAASMWWRRRQQRRRQQRRRQQRQRQRQRQRQQQRQRQRRRFWWTTPCCFVDVTQHIHKACCAVVGMNATGVKDFLGSSMVAWTFLDHLNRCPFFCSHSVRYVKYMSTDTPNKTPHSPNFLFAKQLKHPSDGSRSVWSSLVVGTM